MQGKKDVCCEGEAGDGERNTLRNEEKHEQNTTTTNSTPERHNTQTEIQNPSYLHMKNTFTHLKT